MIFEFLNKKIRKGENVSTNEVAEVLAVFPGISEVAVSDSLKCFF